MANWDDISKKSATIKNLQEGAKAAREMGAAQERLDRYTAFLDKVMNEMEKELEELESKEEKKEK